MVTKPNKKEPGCGGRVILQQRDKADVFHERFRGLGRPKDRLVWRKGPDPLHVGPRVARVDRHIPGERVYVGQGRLDQTDDQPIPGGFVLPDFTGGERDDQIAIERGKIVVEAILSQDGMDVVQVVLGCVGQGGVHVSIEHGKVGVLGIGNRRLRNIPPIQRGWGHREVPDPLSVLGVVEGLQSLGAGKEVRPPINGGGLRVEQLEVLPGGTRCVAGLGSRRGGRGEMTETTN